MTRTPTLHFPEQLLRLVVRPTMNHVGLPGRVSEMMVMGTAAVESGFDAIQQIGGGPALSLWQIEPATVEDLWERAGRNWDDKIEKLVAPFGGEPGDGEGLFTNIINQLPGNLFLGAALCRLIYYYKPFRIDPEFAAGESPMPELIHYLAGLWKEHYNTEKGKGKETDYLDAWERFGLSSLWPVVP